jgi:hypothetical protein
MNAIPTAADPESLPPLVRCSPAAIKIWNALEYVSRGTLLVHGSLAADYAQQGADPHNVIAAMVACGALVPIAVDWNGAGHSLRAFAGLTYGTTGAAHRAITRVPWSVAHSLFWTYSPGNPTPMPYTDIF